MPGGGVLDSSESHGDDERRGPVELLNVVTSACNIAAPLLRHRATLVRDLAPVPMVEGSESRLGQLVLNLLRNAAEAVPEGYARDNEVRVSVRVDAEGWVVLEVSDTGQGIPESGTGFGLSTCHGIVRSLGGDIDVESTPGIGSTFRVRLRASTRPASEPAAEVVASPPAADADARGRRLHVLVVDDEPRVGELLVKLLSPLYEASLELRASNALARIEAGGRYDVILCDLMMPGMTGMDLQEELERDFPELATRTVFMTGGAFTTRAQEFVERFGGRLLEKPFRVADVKRAVKKILGEEITP